MHNRSAGLTVLPHLDNLLRHLLISKVPSLTSEDQVRFQPPDQDWRNVVSNLSPRVALNVYLVDLRENRKLRSNERLRTVDRGVATDTPAPGRVDCHYLITAWSPATVTAAVEPSLDEHALLYEVTAALMSHMPLVPRAAYFPDPLPAGFPSLIADAELPSALLPVEGFPKYAEFWGTMGNVHPWKPAIYLQVTLPVALPTEIAGPLVTTRITEYRQSGRPETAELWIQIGGTVFDASVDPPRAVPRAWVRLETETGNLAVEGATLQTSETNELGRFTFGGLTPGRYRLRTRARDLGERVRLDVVVPSPTGEYDVRFP